MDTGEEALSKLSGGHVLDVATGSGGFIQFLMDNLDDYKEFTGIDNNPRSLEAATQAHPQENVHFRQMDATQMDFPDRHFDTVCMANSLHHMADLPGALAEMKRVLKPGGNFIISEMYRDGQAETQLTHVALHHWWAAVDTAQGIIHFETFTRQQIIEIAEKLGLQQLRLYDLKDLELDPKDPELVQQLDSIIDRYIQRLENLDEATELRQRGEELRQRVHGIGFHGATELLVLGKK